MGKRIERLASSLDEFRRFVTYGVWRIGQPGEQVPHGFVVKHIRVAIVLVRNLVQDALLLRAAALTFATLLAIVPFLAIMFFLIKTFSIDEAVYQRLSNAMSAPQSIVSEEPEQPKEISRSRLVNQLVGLISQQVGQQEQTSEGTPLENPIKVVIEYADRGANPQSIGLAGIVFVITTVFGLMMNIESAFNTIWGLKRTRSWFRIFSDYLMVLLLLPFLAALVLGVTAVLETALSEQFGAFAWLLSGTKYAVIWLAFAVIYFVVPNTRVQARYALLGGVVAGTLWCMVSWAYVRFQLGLPQYSLLYSTFAQVPMLLAWLYVSWAILLFGAELSFAYQNERTYAMEHRAERASYAYREALGLWTMMQLGRRFDAGLPGLTAAESVDAWNVPARLLNDTLDHLEQAGLLIRSASNPPTFQPARSLDKTTVADVLHAIREAGGDPSLLREEKSLQPLLAQVFDRGSVFLKSSLADLIQGQTTN